jgi:hypothetical protein
MTLNTRLAPALDKLMNVSTLARAQHLGRAEQCLYFAQPLLMFFPSLASALLTLLDGLLALSQTLYRGIESLKIIEILNVAATPLG